MPAMHKVTFDQGSGRPIAPLWWRLTTFFVVYAWLMAAVMTYLAYLGFRDGEPRVSAVALAIGTLVVSLAYWERRRVHRERLRFEQMVAAYERVLAKAT